VDRGEPELAGLVLAVLRALLLLLLLLKKKKSTKQPAPEEDDDPFPPMDEDTLTNELEEYISEYGLSDVERWSDADPAADPWGTPDGDNEDKPIFVSEYGFSDYGQREDVGDLEDGPHAPQTDDAEDEVEYAAEYGFSDQGASTDDLE
jgi:hypothetical protein